MLVEALREILASGDWRRLSEVYAPDALLDANVPLWRFQRKGLDEIVAQYEEWYPVPPRVLEWNVTAGAGQEFVVEEAALEGDGPGETYARSAHVLRVVDGLITRHTMYCTGPWDRETVARHAVEAPMFQP